MIYENYGCARARTHLSTYESMSDRGIVCVCVPDLRSEGRWARIHLVVGYLDPSRSCVVGSYAFAH